MLCNLITAFLDFKITSALIRHFISKLVLYLFKDFIYTFAALKTNQHETFMNKFSVYRRNN